MKQEKPWWAPEAQGFVIASVLLMCLWAMTYRMIWPSTVDDKVLDMMMTILFGTSFVAIINYLFGSSRSSAAKDEAITKIAMEPAPSPPPAPPTPPTLKND
jgi:hypothetical protein